MKRAHYKRIILHAGLHKTGTTSIQNNCHRHRDVLLQHGVDYPTFRFRERLLTNHSDPIAGAICSAPQLYGMPQRMHVTDDPREAQETFSEQFTAALEAGVADTLLLSAELLCDFAASDLKTLRKRLRRYTDDLQVIVFVRSPESSLESILQQRNLSGHLIEPETLVGVVSQRFARVERVFSDILQVHNFHEAQAHPSGLVGYFLCTIGLPAEAVAALEFDRRNQRVSQEAHNLIRAINEACPQGGVGIQRVFMDIQPLTTLPGQPFRIDNFKGSEIHAAAVEESRQLALQLGLHFPESARGETQALWQAPTLMALRGTVSRLEHREFRQAVADQLRREAAEIARERADTAAVLEFISLEIEALDEPPTELLLDKLGADYFKFSGLQVERDCPEMALNLMHLALQLRPEAEFIQERVDHYRKRLGKS